MVARRKKHDSRFYKRKGCFMNQDKFNRINQLDEAQFELSKLGPEFYKNTEYLYLRSKIFFINKLYYIALDTLLIATEFEADDKIYNLISKIYNIIGNKELSRKISNTDLRLDTINNLKKKLTGISQKE